MKINLEDADRGHRKGGRSEAARRKRLANWDGETCQTPLNKGGYFTTVRHKGKLRKAETERTQHRFRFTKTKGDKEMGYTVVEKRAWNMIDMRQFCIRHNFYTMGDNEAYGKMLNMVKDTEPTTDNIIKVANDIYYHSEQDEALEVMNLMSMILDEVVKMWYESAVA